jgi:hypothetical protein
MDDPARQAHDRIARALLAMPLAGEDRRARDDRGRFKPEPKRWWPPVRRFVKKHWKSVVVGVLGSALFSAFKGLIGL